MPRPIFCGTPPWPDCPPVPAILVKVGDVIEMIDGTRYVIVEDDPNPVDTGEGEPA